MIYKCNACSWIFDDPVGVCCPECGSDQIRPATTAEERVYEEKQSYLFLVLAGE